MKILNPSSDDIRAQVVNFLEEAKVVSRLSHPGIIPVYNCGVWNDQAFMAMRYMDGGSLERHLKAGTLPKRPLLLAQLATIAEGLAYARSRGVAHHDVKPGNILLTKEGEAKLGDFDLADVSAEKGFSAVRGGFASPAYVSPERLFFGAEDYRGDIFSLGATILRAALRQYAVRHGRGAGGPAGPAAQEGLSAAGESAGRLLLPAVGPGRPHALLFARRAAGVRGDHPGPAPRGGPAGGGAGAGNGNQSAFQPAAETVRQRQLMTAEGV